MHCGHEVGILMKNGIALVLKNPVVCGPRLFLHVPAGKMWKLTTTCRKPRVAGAAADTRQLPKEKEEPKMGEKEKGRKEQKKKAQLSPKEKRKLKREKKK